MKVIYESRLPVDFESAIAIGYFDGVHLGHIELIDDLLVHKDLKKLVFTFDNKPTNTKDIFTIEEKEDMLNNLHIDYFYIQRFTKRFATMDPHDFLVFLKTMFNIRHITVGFDFKFGKVASGNVELLEKCSKELNYTLSVIPKISVGDVKVSSTAIKEFLREGNVDMAANMLGKYYFADGIVKKGRQLGSRLGFPTANITTTKLTPKCGVYATKTAIDNHLYNSITNVGKNPTISSNNPINIETNIFDFNKDIYGKKIRVYFVDFIRTEKKFESAQELKSRVTQDMEMAKNILSI